jgi:Ca2+-binding RTX toxin-like protein
MKRYRLRRAFFTIIGVFLFFILISVFSAYTASNSVPSFSLDEDTLGVSPSDFLPADCINAGITYVDNVIEAIPGEWTNGTDQNDLILGTSERDRIVGGGGDDCIMGGDGDERFWLIIWLPTLWGGSGDDVIIGGPGNDYCAGQGGNNTIDCEVNW